MQELTRADADAVALQFALGEVLADPVFVQRGAMGSIWKLTTRTDAWAAKSLFPWTDFDAAKRDFLIQEAASAAGIPIARPRRTEGGEVVARSNQHRVRVYEWVELVPDPAPDYPVPADETRSVGGLLARIHLADLGPAGGEPGDWYMQPPTSDEWTALVQAAESASSPFAPGLAAQLPLLESLGELVRGAPRMPTVVCHRDFGRSNVRRTANGGWVVLDWEDAGPYAPERELAGVLHGWCTSFDATNIASARSFCEGYGAAGGTIPVFERHHFALRVCSHLNFLKVQLRAAIDAAAGPHHREYAINAVDVLLESRIPALLPRADELIAALR